MPGNDNHGTYTRLPTRMYKSHAPIPGSDEPSISTGFSVENLQKMETERYTLIEYSLATLIESFYKFLVLDCCLRIQLKLEGLLVVPCYNIEIKLPPVVPRHHRRVKTGTSPLG